MRISVSLREVPLAAALVCLLGAATFSQSSNGGVDTDPADPGTGGANVIEGKLYYPGGRVFDQRVEVTLRSLATDHRSYTDGNGAFTFRRLGGGTYYILVDAGKEFQPVKETVDIISSGKGQAIGQTYTVQINLEPASTVATPPPGTISARGFAIPEEAAASYREAMSLSRAGERAKAIEQLKKALSIYPNFMQALNELGVQYLRLRQSDKAAESLEAALKIAPDAFAPRLNYGIALVRLKRYEPALATLRRAVDQDGSSAAAHLYLGEALIGMASYIQAKTELMRAIGIGGEDGIEAHRYLAAALIETGEKSQAATELETYLRLNPKASDADRINQVIRKLRK